MARVFNIVRLAGLALYNKLDSELADIKTQFPGIGGDAATDEDLRWLSAYLLSALGHKVRGDSTQYIGLLQVTCSAQSVDRGADIAHDEPFILAGRVQQVLSEEPIDIRDTSGVTVGCMRLVVDPKYAYIAPQNIVKPNLGVNFQPTHSHSVMLTFRFAITSG